MGDSRSYRNTACSCGDQLLGGFYAVVGGYVGERFFELVRALFSRDITVPIGMSRICAHSRSQGGSLSDLRDNLRLKKALRRAVSNDFARSSSSRTFVN